MICPRWVAGIEKAIWILVAAFFSGGGCASIPVSGAQYWRIETPSLEILSILSEEETRRITEDLLLFRDVVHSITTLKTDYARVPTTLIVLDKKTWKDLEPPKGGLGFFASSLERNWLVTSPMAIRSIGRQNFQFVLQHEYAHFLVANDRHAEVPIWFHEGWAEVISTVRVKGGQVRIGEPPPLRYPYPSEAPHLTLRRVIVSQDLPKTPVLQSVFYAQSWSLTHFLMLGSLRSNEFNENQKKYLKALSQGQDPQKAFESSFGWKMSTLENRLRAYAAGKEQIRSLRIDRNRFAPIPVLEIERVNAEVVANQVGRLQLFLKQPAQARRYFEAVLQRDPNNARARSGLGVALAALGHGEEGLAEAQMGLALDPTRGAHLDLAGVLLSLAEAAPGDPRQASWLRTSRQQYRLALQQAPDSAAAYVGLGSTFLLEGQPAQKGLADLRRGYELAPANPQAQWALALGLLSVAQEDEAEPLLRRIVAFGNASPSVRAEADRRLQSITKSGPQSIAAQSDNPPSQ